MASKNLIHSSLSFSLSPYADFFFHFFNSHTAHAHTAVAVRLRSTLFLLSDDDVQFDEGISLTLNQFVIYLPNLEQAIRIIGSMSAQNTRLIVPALFQDPEFLLPLKIDLTLKGSRYVDSFCMSIKSSSFDVYELAWQTRCDLNLPNGFQWRIYLQLQEQIIAYRELVSAFLMAASMPCPAYPELQPLQQMAVGLRFHTTDYVDKFHWDIFSQLCSPETFAKVTCAELGLPAEMEPAISHRIRENIVRLKFCCALLICSNII